MKLRVSVVLSRGAVRDVVLACDVTTTVADIARALVRAGVSADPRLNGAAQHRLAPVTLRVASDHSARPTQLDPMAPVASSGLQAGQFIQPVLEFGAPGNAERAVEAAGFVHVLNGDQRGVEYSLIVGTNLIGRDRACRVQLLNRSVSRRHAQVHIGEDGSCTVSDLGSANGIFLDGERCESLRVDGPTQLRLGDIDIRLTPGPATGAPPHLSHRVLHTRSPRIAPRFQGSERELPAPPVPAQPSRIPAIALLAPVAMGCAMYAITRSPMSLFMVAFTPMMMLGSWLDGTLGGRRRYRAQTRRFENDLRWERHTLSDLRVQEVEVRAAETPDSAQVRRAIETRSELLWTRRPEHRSFLEVRLGDGVRPSRTRTKLPERGEAIAEDWEALRRFAREFEQVGPVPVTERFERCGSLGIVGGGTGAVEAAASIVLQLVALHSPEELVLACFGGPVHEPSWAWLKWLPHVDPVASPIRSWHLADSEPSSLSLLTALEGVIQARESQRSVRGGIRSHLSASRTDDASEAAVEELPLLPVVIVLVLEDRLVDTARLIALAEKGPDLGIHVIWVARSRAALPAACRTFLEIESGDARVQFVRSASTVTLSRYEQVDPALAHRLARSLAPVEDTAARSLDESDLPKQVELRELHHVDLLGGAGPIMQSWAASGSLTAHWRKGQQRDPISLAAIVGQSPDGPTTIDLRSHGPHALVGGTTGSGKSEFLQSWIMSMAATVSPERLTYLLVDYKGGAAFAECVDLPHTVGLVTDLTPHLVRRALKSLRAELHYREALLAAQGAKDLVSMERGSDPAAPPMLLIVIDEFAALAREVPEFVEGVVDIAQRGRSLGLHLIMATQRPAGVITDNLRANTNARVALRMADESDSTDVIGVKDAAFFDAEMPGRGALKIGPGVITHFQTGYLGGRASGQAKGASIEVRSLKFTEGAPWMIPPEVLPSDPSTAAMRDIERLRDGIVDAAHRLDLPPPRRPWLDELPSRLTLAELTRRTLGKGADHDGVLLGLRDDPAAQTQQPVRIDFENAGNIAFLGASGTGKTSALITLAASVSEMAVLEPVQVYAIDAAGGALDVIAALPTVGAVAPLADTELVGRVLTHLRETIAERGPRYAAVRANGLNAYRSLAAGASEGGSPAAAQDPRIVLLLDGFAAFRQATEAVGGVDNPYQLLSEIMSQGRSVGVHVVLTGDRPAAIPAALSANVQRQYVLRLANPFDYGALGIPADVGENAPPGRALLAGDDREIHIALVSAAAREASTGQTTDLAGQGAGIEELAAKLRAQRVEPAQRVANAPNQLSLHELPPSAQQRPVFGIDVRTFAPVSLPRRGLGVIAGPSGSGVSEAALSCVAALERAAAEHDQALDSVLLSFAENGLRHRHDWDRVALGEYEIERLAEELVAALGGRAVVGPPGIAGALFDRAALGEDATGSLGAAHRGAGTIGSGRGSGNGGTPGRRQVFPAQGRLGVIVVERPAEAEGTAALRQLTALARAAKRADVLVLFEFETGTGGGVWELYQVLKQHSWGLSLQPDQQETQTPFREDLGRVKRTDFPPGRGFAIEKGSITAVQVATAPKGVRSASGTPRSASTAAVDSVPRQG